ncbi:SusC/RagA family TonB-linked outer membrane protein [Sediminibacterium sp. WSJ-3]|nr:SusC/RagA family TonB-linked outer membrane protein [Sediminibacterium soli]
MLLLLVILLSTATGYSQSKKVNGTIRDGKGAPVAGVSVKVKNSASGGTVSDADGKFSLTVPGPAAVLGFSFVGYLDREERVGDRSAIDIVLNESASNLEDVVVIGYGGLAKKKDATGATAQVNAKAIAEKNPVTLFDALQGQAAGVLITNDNGDPAGQGTIQIRGASTINAEGNGPLWVIDGVLSENGRFLNPADIETIDILKDASSAAIYGARGANGVILVTTKKGKGGKPSINLNYYHLFGKLAHKLRTTTAAELRAYRASRDNNSGYNADSTNPYLNADNDYQDLLFKTAHKQVASVSVSGGGSGLNYYGGVTYTDDQSIVLNSWIKRVQSKINVGYTAGKFSVTNNLSFAWETGNTIPVGNSAKQVFERNPWTSIYRPDGSYASYVESKRNPVAQALFNRDIDNNYVVQFNTTLSYQLFKTLKYTSLFNAQLTNNTNNQFSPSSLTSGGTGDATGSNTFEKTVNWEVQGYFNYNEKFGSKHTVAATLGFSADKWRNDYYTVAMSKYVTENINTSNAGLIDLTKTRTTAWARSNASFFGRVNYNYDGKYILQGTVRRDGSSRFGANNKWGNFFSVSAAWRFTQEKFMSWTRDVLYDGKLRYSRGRTGNDAIGNYASYTVMSFGQYYNGQIGAGINTTLGNNIIQWETTSDNNYGIDLSFLKGRLTFSVDYYTKLTKDLLYRDELAKESGGSAVTVNVGSIRNTGLEFTVTGTPVSTKNFTWDVSANLTFQDARIEQLAGGASFIAGNKWLIREGGRLGDFYIWKNLGVYAYDQSNAYDGSWNKLNPVFDASGAFTGYTDNTGKSYTGTINQLKRNGIVLQGGDTEWLDVNKDGIIDETDKVIGGNGLPTRFFGISNTFRYKNISLNIFINGQFGNDIYNLVRNQQNENRSTYTPPIWDAVLYAWRKQGDATVYPYFNRRDDRGSISTGYNSLYVEDGSFIRLSSVRLNYTFAPKLVNKVKLKGASVYVYGNNLLMWTNYSWYDPEFSSRGLTIGEDGGKYPKRREVGVGVNVNF